MIFQDLEFLKEHPRSLLKDEKIISIFEKTEKPIFPPHPSFIRLFGPQPKEEFQTPLSTYQEMIGLNGANILKK